MIPFIKILLLRSLLYFISSILIVSLFLLNDYLFSLYNTNYIIILKDDEYYKLWIMVLGLLLIKNKKFKITFIFFLLFIQLLEFFYFQYFGTAIQAIGFYQIFVNGGEIIDSFWDEALTMIIPLILIILSATLLIFILRFSSFTIFNYSSILGVLIIISVFGYQLNHTYINLHSKSGKLWNKQAKQLLPMPGKLSIVNFTRALNYFILGILPKKVFSNNQNNNFKLLPPPKIINSNPDINIVFIIGETLRAKSLSLLGYEKDTTPLLSKVDGLYAKTIYSAGTMTKTSVSALLNRVKYPGATVQMLTQQNCLFNLAKNNGFTTHFYSAQSENQLNILQSFICRKYIDFYESKTSLKKKRNNLSKYDISLLDAIKNVDFNKGNHFLVLHQRGSHSPYKKQYPKKFNKFKNSYNNTVLYTDFILSEIIKYLKKNTKKETYFIFTSDHGELLHEHGRNGHGWFYKEVYQVPFIFHDINNEYYHNKLDTIQSHFQVSNLISKLLGYDIVLKKMNDIYVNGSDIDALAGYLHIKIDDNGKEKSVIEIRD